MNRPALLAASTLALALTACGDTRSDYAGTYDFSGTLRVTLVSPGMPRQDFRMAARIELIADALDADRLYVAFDCGLDAQEKDGAFTLPQKLCPQVVSGDCRYRSIYDHGTLKWDDVSQSLVLTLSGAYTAFCKDGSSSREDFTMTMSGREADLGKPPPDSYVDPTNTQQALPRGLLRALEHRGPGSGTGG